MIKDCLEDSSSFPWFLNKSGATVEKHVEKQQSKKFKNIEEHPLLFNMMYFYQDDQGLLMDQTKFHEPHLRLIWTICKQFVLKEKIKKIHILRARANLMLQVKNFKKDGHNTPHIDFEFPHYILIYYIDNTDGDTFLFKKDNSVMARIKPEPNKLLFFDGLIYHASSNPVKNKSRKVINISFTKGDNLI